MFSFENASLSISKDEILKYVTHLQIFERYCINFTDLGSKFKSEFYNDKNPSCRIVIAGSGIPYYKDHGNGDYFTSFEYVSKKFGSSYHETCNIIANDFNLKKSNLNIAPQLLLNTTEPPKLNKVRSDIAVVSRPFSIIDVNYWSQYKINLTTLNLFNVKACIHVFLKKGENHYHYEYKRDNPIYSYRFYKNGKEYYKIYFPLATKDRKWISNVGADCLSGYDQLPELGELLIITKSLKDCMVLYEMGYNSVALQAETNKVSKKSYKELSKRFKKIVLLMDNDETGIKASEELSKEFNIPYIFVDIEKDISDYVKSYDFESGRNMIKYKLSKI